MATIETVTENDGGQAVEPATAQQAEPPSVTTQTIAPDHRHDTVQQRSTTLLATVLGAVVAALIGGMFLFIVFALDRVSEDINRVSEEVSSLRSEMNARFAEMNARFVETDRRFDQVNSVLMDHTDHLARIETTLDISGRPLPSETDDPTGP